MVSSVPAGARISLNGIDTGRVTPSAVALGGKDPATIELNLKGHQVLSSTLTAADLKRGRREFKLAREAQPVKVTVNGPFQFEIRQGEKVLSAMAAHHEVTVSPGSGPLSAVNADYLLNEALTIEFDKPEAQIAIRPLGELAVYASAETCSVVVDGRDLGFPPIARKPIASGPHTVTLKCRDGKEESRKITIKPADFLPVTFR